MIVGIHHVAISVPDIELAARFYMDTLGFSETFASEWDSKPLNDRVIGVDGTSAKVRMLRTSNVFVELWEYRRPVPVTQDPDYSPANHGYAHIGLQVTNIHAEYERLTRAGMTFHAPPVDLGASAAIYGRDPFGNIIELYQVTGKGALPTADETTMRLRRLEDVEKIRQLKAAVLHGVRRRSQRRPSGRTVCAHGSLGQLDGPGSHRARGDPQLLPDNPGFGQHQTLVAHGDEPGHRRRRRLRNGLVEFHDGVHLADRRSVPNHRLLSRAICPPRQPMALR